MRQLRVALIAMFSVSMAAPAAADSFFFGEDVLSDPGYPVVPASFPSSSAAESGFRAAIGFGSFEAESFEGFADLDMGPLNIFQGGLLTGVLTDSVASEGSVREVPLDDEVSRGFPIDGSRFWQNETTLSPSDELFRVTFSEELRSFGFYATAWSTQSSLGATALVLDLIPAIGTASTVAIPHEEGANLAGSSFYFGVISDVPFIAAALRNSSAIDGGDSIGFDGFTAAIVPEPSTAMLLGAGLVALSAGRRRYD